MCSKFPQNSRKRLASEQISLSRQQLSCGIDEVYLARPERFELPTPWFVARYSIQLSYGRGVMRCAGESAGAAGKGVHSTGWTGGRPDCQRPRAFERGDAAASVPSRRQG